MNEKYFIDMLEQEFQANHAPTSDSVYFTEQDYQELQRNLILYKQKDLINKEIYFCMLQ